MDCGSMTWGISLLSDIQRTLALFFLLRDSETTVNWATFIVAVNLLNTIPEEKQYKVDVLEPDNSEEDVGEKNILGIE